MSLENLSPKPKVPNKPEASKSFRTVARTIRILAMAVAAVLGAAATGEIVIDRAADARTEDLRGMENFLRGESSEKRTVFGREVDFKKFIAFIKKFLDPLLDSFNYMMEIEIFIPAGQLRHS